MGMIKNGSLFIFRLFGVNVYLHWSWIVVAFVEIWVLGDKARGLGVQIAIYLGLFLIVLLHEFGHALACKSVGGRAEHIMLWPLGGVAYVQPPQRPGAFLWSIAAGPLVNVILVPITLVLMFVTAGVPGDVPWFFESLATINIALLVFNMLPFYPLDGGQILRSLLWFVAGRALSLIIATIIGIIGAVLLALLAFWLAGPWLGVVVAYMGVRSITSLRQAFDLYKMENAPRHEEAVCPACHEHPPYAPIWICRCGARFDTFQNGAACPECGTAFSTTSCPFCLENSQTALWYPQTQPM